ncbi:MAG: gliding motility-associated ABC transporter ATP-binding subunit GldA [Bacteroidetes bacterium]|nr:gliding motility-associated ABC transporter ATP-binding subunit GldA [Bacteroidota bacterium]
MSIKVNNITKLFGEQKALYNVCFEIKSGEIVGLLGPNGAGKSTLMKIITCFIPPTSGVVSVNGFDILEQSIEVRKRVGYLPENNPLYLDMYVREYLEFIAGIHKLGDKTKERIDLMIDITGLEVERKKKIGALSKGFRQRVGLAQAMIHDPEVLILDEPTSGLDPNQIVEIRNLISKIGKEKTVMLSTHIMQEVEAICHRAIIINKGVIVADAPTDQLSNQFFNRSIITVEFDKAFNIELLNTMEGVKKLTIIKENTWEIECESQKDLRQDIFNFAVKNQLSVLTIHKEEEKLEKVFHELTKKK